MKKIIILALINILLCSITAVYASKFDDLVVEGWAFEKIEAGKKVYSIQADKATFGTKRIGFFNLAAIKVVNLENVLLIVYNNGVVVNNQHFDRAVYELNSRRLLDEHGNEVFRE